ETCVGPGDSGGPAFIRTGKNPDKATSYQIGGVIRLPQLHGLGPPETTVPPKPEPNMPKVERPAMPCMGAPAMANCGGGGGRDAGPVRALLNDYGAASGTLIVAPGRPETSHRNASHFFRRGLPGRGRRRLGRRLGRRRRCRQ